MQIPQLSAPFRSITIGKSNGWLLWDTHQQEYVVSTMITMERRIVGEKRNLWEVPLFYLTSILFCVIIRMKGEIVCGLKI